MSANDPDARSPLIWGGWILACVALVALAWVWTHRQAEPAKVVTQQAEVKPGPVLSPAPVMPSAALPALESWETIIGRSMNAVVQVETSRGFGSGFFIGPETILTSDLGADRRCPESRQQWWPFAESAWRGHRDQHPELPRSSGIELRSGHRTCSRPGGKQ